MDIALYTKDEVKCKLIAYERCSKTTITFSKDKYREDKYNEYINEFKSNKNIHKASLIRLKQSSRVAYYLIIMQNLIKVNKKMRHISLNRIRF